MKQVYKYILEVTEHIQKLNLPVGFEILNVQEQNGHITLWIEIDTAYAMQSPRRFKVVGTGWDFEKEAFVYIGTVQIYPFVWHIYME